MERLPNARESPGFRKRVGFRPEIRTRFSDLNRSNNTPNFGLPLALSSLPVTVQRSALLCGSHTLPPSADFPARFCSPPVGRSQDLSRPTPAVYSFAVLRQVSPPPLPTIPWSLDT
ncbi:uncharacterized protein BDV14DRAFT_174361 [Aspergillus stella-maris]|uniref:uncharacterized protein n=1 Tax=Aspergillus stella-maris TaxID=1810926 RepID=UPI003CCC90BB